MNSCQGNEPKNCSAANSGCKTIYKENNDIVSRVSIDYHLMQYLLQKAGTLVKYLIIQH